MENLFTVHLSDDLANKLDRLALALNRSEIWLIEQAIRSFVEELSRQADAIGEALNTFRNGTAELVPRELVMAKLARRVQVEA